MKKLSLIVLAVLMIALPLAAAVSPAQADTATFLQRETNNLQGWYDFYKKPYPGYQEQLEQTYDWWEPRARDYWRAQAATAVSLATLYRRTGDINAAIDADDLLNHLYAGTDQGTQLKTYGAYPCSSYYTGTQTEILMHWITAYQLLRGAGWYAKGNPWWDAALLDNADYWSSHGVCPGNWIGESTPPNDGDTDAEENAPAAAFLAIVHATYPSAPNSSTYWNASARWGFHTSTYITTDLRRYTCGYTNPETGETECSSQLHNDTGYPPPYYRKGLTTANPSGSSPAYKSTPRYGLASLGERGIGTVIHKRISGNWGHGDLDRYVKYYWFPWNWHETRLPEGYNDWGDTAQFYCGFDDNLAEERDWTGVRADLTSAMAAAYHDVRFGTSYTDDIEPFLPQSPNDFVAPMDEVVTRCSGGRTSLRDAMGDDIASMVYDCVLMSRVGYAVIAKDTGVTMTPVW